MRMPGCYRAIIQNFGIESKGVFRIFGAIGNLANLEVRVDHAAPLLTGIPEPA